MKIYNEIVIDMNPESSSYEQVLYEESFEYFGNLMLLHRTPVAHQHTRTYNDGIPIITGNYEEDRRRYNAQRAREGDFNRQDRRLNKKPPPITPEEENLQNLDVQTGELPSLPEASIMGTDAYTGIVNWNTIPGGFQPLPQVAGKNKKLYQLSQFHGGINQKSSPRDISDLECQEATNVTVSNMGSVKLLGDIQSTDNGITVDDTNTIADRGASGYGLFQFSAPAATDDTAGEHTITLTPDGHALDAYNTISGSATTVDNFIQYNGTDDHDVAHVVYAAGNGVYACDANFATTDNLRMAKVYLYRKDYDSSGSASDLVTSGWQTAGKPAIDSPTFDTSTAPTGTVSRVNLEFDDISSGSNVAFASTSTQGSATVHLGVDADNEGDWDGNYLFYISWLFDNGCETGLTALQTTVTSYSCNSERLEFNFSVEDDHSSRKHIGGDARIEGARVYYKKHGTAERFLLAEVSLVNGVRGALETTFVPWDEVSGNANAFTLANNLLFDVPPDGITYDVLHGGVLANEIYNESPDILADGGSGPVAYDVRYKAAAIASNGIVFIGNVKFDGEHLPDSMMWSVPATLTTPPQPGIFPKYQSFDSPSSDGSPITALAAFGDSVLQFKENALYAINISNMDSFYAEAVFRNCGVSNPCQVFTAEFGVIFANKFGCFIYDGEGVVSLTSGKFDIGDWGLSESSLVTSLTSATRDACNIPCVGYDPRSQNIIVIKDIGDDSTDESAWVYSMVTQSWTEGNDMITNADGNRHSNFIVTSGGYLSMLRDDSTSVYNYNQGQASSNAQTVTYITKDMDFGFPTQTKKIFKIYVTYQGDADSLTCTYGANGDTTPTETMTNSETSDGTLTDAGTTDHNVATLTLDSHPTSLKSIALKFTGSVGEDFQINDISILYRLRPIK